MNPITRSELNTIEYDFQEIINKGNGKITPKQKAMIETVYKRMQDTIEKEGGKGAISMIWNNTVAPLYNRVKDLPVSNEATPAASTSTSSAAHTTAGQIHKITDKPTTKGKADGKQTDRDVKQAEWDKKIPKAASATTGTAANGEVTVKPVPIATTATTSGGAPARSSTAIKPELSRVLREGVAHMGGLLMSLRRQVEDLETFVSSDFLGTIKEGAESLKEKISGLLKDYNKEDLATNSEASKDLLKIYNQILLETSTIELKKSYKKMEKLRERIETTSSLESLAKLESKIEQSYSTALQAHQPFAEVSDTIKSLLEEYHTDYENAQNEIQIRKEELSKITPKGDS